MIDKVLNDIRAERKRQHKLWGDQSGHPDTKWLAILVEEVGEAAQSILEDDPPSWLQTELVQVAAVAVQWLEVLYGRDSSNQET